MNLGDMMAGLGESPFEVRLELGKRAEQAFYDTCIMYGVPLMNENLSMGQRAEGDEVLNHTPDFYWKERDVFFEVKMSYFMRTDLFDLSEQWLKQYGNIGSRLYYTIYAKDNPDIEFYKLEDLQTLKNQYDIGKWASDGNKYYVIDKKITPHLKLKKMSELFI